MALAHGGAKHEMSANSAVKEQMLWGIAGDRGKADRTVEIRMTDTMRFSPSEIQVKRGETVRFVLRNDGRMLHEMVVGTQVALAEHAAAMRKFPGMEHDEPYMAHVAPGKTGEIVWQFNRSGDFEFACLIPGHHEAGMVGKIAVKP
ncbi:MAG: cupredoxin family protein [Pseudomonadota bacterium]